MTDQELRIVKGIGPVSAKKLMLAGIPSISVLAKSSPEQVAEVTRLGRRRAIAVVEAAQEIVAGQFKGPQSLQERLSPASGESLLQAKEKGKKKKGKGKGKKKKGKKKKAKGGSKGKKAKKKKDKKKNKKKKKKKSKEARKR